MSMLMAKLHNFLATLACLWDTLYRDSHKHAQYMYQHSVIWSWACLRPNCIIFVCVSACLWDSLHRDYHKHAQYMYQHSVINMVMSMLMAKLHNFRAPMACLWDILYINSHKHAHFMYQHSVICWWVCFRPNCIIFLCLWRAYEILCVGILILKHAQYMYQDYVMCSWACLWPNCIIFMGLWRTYETPYIGILISTPSICTNIL